MAGDERRKPRLPNVGPQSGMGPPILKSQQPAPESVGSPDANTHNQFVDALIRVGQLLWNIGPLGAKGPPLLRRQTDPAALQSGYPADAIASRDESTARPPRRLLRGTQAGMGDPHTQDGGPPVLRTQQMGDTQDTRLGPDQQATWPKLTTLGRADRNQGPPVLKHQDYEYLAAPVGGGPGTFTTLVGTVVVSGGVSTFTGRGQFVTTVGTVTVAGGSSTFTGKGKFTTTVGTVTVSGGSSSFGGKGNFSTTAGTVTVSGGSSTFTGKATFTTLAGTVTVSGGVSTFSHGGPATFTTLAGEVIVSGGVSTFSGGAGAVAPGGAPFGTRFPPIFLPPPIIPRKGRFETICGTVTVTGGVSTFEGKTAWPFTVDGHNDNVIRILELV